MQVTSLSIQFREDKDDKGEGVVDYSEFLRHGYQTPMLVTTMLKCIQFNCYFACHIWYYLFNYQMTLHIENTFDNDLWWSVKSSFYMTCIYNSILYIMEVISMLSNLVQNASSSPST